MGAQGTVEIDFGAFPGKSDASVAVTGQASILGTSLVEAWIFPIATTDHAADEHLVETIRVIAGNVVAGVGFTVYGFNTSEIHQSLRARAPQGPSIVTKGAITVFQVAAPYIGGQGTRIYGKWTVGWVWN
jgi:hypothetical protein